MAKKATVTHKLTGDSQCSDDALKEPMNRRFDGGATFGMDLSALKACRPRYLECQNVALEQMVVKEDGFI